MAPVHEYKLVIRESHLDTFGHVNNATYLELFEEARWEIITSRGYGLKEVRERGIGPVILGINMQFRREVLLRENVTIRTWIGEEAGKITTLKQAMINERGEEACTADFTMALFDLKARKIIAPTPEWKIALGLE